MPTWPMLIAYVIIQSSGRWTTAISAALCRRLVGSITLTKRRSGLNASWSPE